MRELAEVQEVRSVEAGRWAKLAGWRFWSGVVAVALVGAVMVVAAARVRMGMNTDGTAYYGTTRKVMAGDGPRWPYGSRDQELTLTAHFPPLFPVVVGYLSNALGVGDPRVTVEFLHGLLLAATGVLLGWMVRRYTRSGWWGLGAVVFVVFSADVLDAYACFMSEPLFIFLGMAGLVAVDSGARRKGWAGAVGLVFLGGVLIGAACWCRYAGIAWIAAAGVGLLFYPKMAWRRRVVLAATAGVPMVAAWCSLSAYVYGVVHSSMSRGIRFQADQLVYLAALVEAPLQWMVPAWNVHQGALVAVGFLLALVLVVRGLRTTRALEAGSLAGADQGGVLEVPWVFVSGAVLYAALMVFSAVCVDPPATPIEHRLLVPWLPMLVIVGAWWLCRRVRISAHAELARQGLMMMLVVAVVGNMPKLLERLRGDEQHWVGYTAAKWQESETARWVRKHVPAGALIYCNRCDALYYLADRNSVWVPWSHDGSANGMPRKELGAEVNRMCEAMGREHGYLVCFADTWAEEFGAASTEEMMDAVSKGELVPVALTKDGVIYRWSAEGEGDAGNETAR